MFFFQMTDVVKQLSLKQSKVKLFTCRFHRPRAMQMSDPLKTALTMGQVLNRLFRIEIGISDDIDLQSWQLVSVVIALDHEQKKWGNISPTLRRFHALRK